MKLLWTFRLVGGEPLSLKARQGLPTMEHQGSLSVWSILLTEEEASALEALLVEKGIKVGRWAEGPSAEQMAERSALLKAQAGEMEFPTARCPECFWMDLGEAGLCGLRGWHSAVREEALRTHARARGDALSCPLANVDEP